MSTISDFHLTIRFVTNKSLTCVGTCFAISKSSYLTAKHVVEDLDLVFITDKDETDHKNKTRYHYLIPATVIWRSEHFDLAIITPTDPSKHTEPSAVFKKPTQAIHLNSEVTSLGYPLAQTRSTDATVSAIIARSFFGNVTSLYEDNWLKKDHPIIEVFFPILKGQSGAPLLTHRVKFEDALIGICLGQSEAYTEEREDFEDFYESTGGKITSRTIIRSGWRFGLCINLAEAISREPIIATFFNE